MRNKGFIIFLTTIVTLLCLYYISFTFVSRNIEKEATELSRDESGAIDYKKRQEYLDSIWQEPVYSFLGKAYTYKEVKKTQLNQGLDLQGGMHVTLEVSPVEIIKGISGNNTDENFLAAIERAKELQRSSQGSFVDLFYQAFQEIQPDGRLSTIFSNAANRGRISFDTPDSDILDIINQEVDDAIDRSFQILRTRVDRFGTSQPNIQKLENTGRIQVELPGVDNPERVRKLLQGVAKLEFWEVWNMNESTAATTIQAINDRLVQEQQAQAALNSEDTTQTSSDENALSNLQVPQNDSDSVPDGAQELANQLNSQDSTQIDSLNALNANTPQNCLL